MRIRTRRRSFRVFSRREKASTAKGISSSGSPFRSSAGSQRNMLPSRSSSLPALLSSRIHEHRLVAVLILMEKYGKGDDESRGEIFDFYLRHVKHVNNWDLVDLSAGRILGQYLLDKDRALLYTLARSKNMWERRMAVMATFAFIRAGEFDDTFRIAKILLSDRHDLIHKAAGWMLREIGKRDQKKEEAFLATYCREMPRTMLRYAIERFDEERRKYYLRRVVLGES